jgi:hypothetical protein
VEGEPLRSPSCGHEIVIDLRYASRLIRLEPGAVPEQLTLIGSHSASTRAANTWPVTGRT